ERSLLLHAAKLGRVFHEDLPELLGQRRGVVGIRARLDAHDAAPVAHLQYGFKKFEAREQDARIVAMRPEKLSMIVVGGQVAADSMRAIRGAVTGLNG